VAAGVPARQRVVASLWLRRQAVTAGDQPQDGEGAGPRSAAHAARPRRRGDRMTLGRMSLTGQRRPMTLGVGPGSRTGMIRNPTRFHKMGHAGCSLQRSRTTMQNHETANEDAPKPTARNKGKLIGPKPPLRQLGRRVRHVPGLNTCSGHPRLGCAVKTWMPSQVGCFRLGQTIIAEVGNTRLRMTSAGMTAERLIQSERNPL
jgi:hypothetical protein